MNLIKLMIIFFIVNFEVFVKLITVYAISVCVSEILLTVRDNNINEQLFFGMCKA